MSARGILRPAVGILISGVCLVLLSRTVALDEVAGSLRAANAALLVPAIAVYLLGTLARSLRWKTLLRAYPVPLATLFRTLVIGYMVNDLLPWRLGELARIFLLARNASVPVGASFASIVVERVLDGLTLTAFLGLGMLWAGAGGWLLLLAAFSLGLFGLATAAVVWAALSPQPARRLGYGMAGLTPARFHERAKRLVDTALEGLAPVARPATAARVVLLSFLVWGLEAGMYLIIMAAFSVPGGLPATLMGMGAANLATVVPSSPGYVGTFDLPLQRILVEVFGASPGSATSYTLTVHLAFVAPMVVLGLFFLWRENLSLPELARSPRRAPDPPVAGR